MTVLCPVCGAAEKQPAFQAAEYLFRERDYAYSTCLRCGHVFVDPVPTAEELRTFYTRAAARLGEIYPSSGSSETDLTELPAEVEKIDFLRSENILQDRGSVLDIGFGKGGFLLSMMREGWDCTGVELTEDVELPAAVDGKFRALFGGRGLEMLDPDGYDLITLWHVLEHLESPREILRLAQKHLKADGRLIVAVPNFDGLSARLFRRRWFGAIPPWHLHLFAPRTLTLLLARSGLIANTITGFGRMESLLLWIESFSRTLDEVPAGVLAIPKRFMLRAARKSTSISMPLTLRLEKKIGRPSAIVAIGEKNRFYEVE